MKITRLTDDYPAHEGVIDPLGEDIKQFIEARENDDDFLWFSNKYLPKGKKLKAGYYAYVELDA